MSRFIYRSLLILLGIKVMGFIASLLCGSSDSDSSRKQKGRNSSSSNNSNKGSSGSSSEKSKSKNTLSAKKSGRPGVAATHSRQSEIHTTLSNSTAKMHLKKKNAANKHSSTVAAVASAPVEKSPLSKNTAAVSNNDTDSDVVDVDMVGEEDDDVDVKGDEKQTLLVYNAESDTSTGTTADTAVSATQPTAEVTTTIHETEHTSSADDSEGIHSQGVSDVEMTNGEPEDGEPLDLSQLQPDQAHAPGCNTLLLPKADMFKGKKCLVLDLDETLVHSSFKYLRTADFVIPVEIDNQVHNVYVIKRPGVDEFLRCITELYEVVVFTASVSRYGDPLLDILDKDKTIHHRLFRDSCYNYEGNYIKNLSQIGRPLSDMIILDNSPASYIFHPQHAIPISSWFSDAHDNELLDIIPLLEDLAEERVPDVGEILDVTI